jgi:DNA-binding NtrC family response regulator
MLWLGQGASTPMKMALLQLLEDGAAPRRIKIQKMRFTVGRHDCDVRLEDPRKSVSRHHASLLRRDEGYLLVDEDSRNGTRVNGVHVARRLLRDGDHIEFGRVAATFHWVEEEAPAARAADRPLPCDGAVPADDAGPTRCLTQSQTAPDFTLRQVAAWQAVQRYAESTTRPLRKILHDVVQDLAGVRSLRRVLLHLPAEDAAGALWIRAGATTPRAGILFEEEHMLRVATQRAALVTVGGRLCAAVEGTAPEALCVPLADGDRAGFLFVEAGDHLDAATEEAVWGVAWGLETAFRLRRNGSTRPSSCTGVSGPHSAIVGASPSLRAAVQMAARAATSDSTVLIRGESGTGKELFARLVYAESPRRHGPFVAVHCSAIEDTLLGSALFGHEKGAFTGAVGLKKGLFEEADGGTLFLDEIGELSSDMQVKLLRVLQEGEFMRVGGTQTIRVDVRVIAATNRNLEAALQAGRFRNDLYYRLKVIEVPLPALRERKEDIADLVSHFVAELRQTTATPVTEVTSAALQVLQAYDWPGNIRELRNVVERALVLADGPMLTPEDLPPEVVLAAHAAPGPSAGRTPDTRLDGVQRRHIHEVMKECNGNKRLAAVRLGISRSTLYEKLKAMGEIPAGVGLPDGPDRKADTAPGHGTSRSAN